MSASRSIRRKRVQNPCEAWQQSRYRSGAFGWRKEDEVVSRPEDRFVECVRKKEGNCFE